MVKMPRCASARECREAHVIITDCKKDYRTLGKLRKEKQNGFKYQSMFVWCRLSFFPKQTCKGSFTKRDRGRGLEIGC